MAGFILVCSRHRGSSPVAGGDAEDCASRLGPDNIQPNPPLVLQQPGLTRVVVNPVEGVRVDDHGVLLGGLFEDADWSALGSPPPDGTFAIVRHDDGQVELLTDVFASRTIWYVHTDDVFMASTSQRALVALLGSFEPCPESVTWLLAAGNLGPNRGWDGRLQRLASATRLRLDRETWALTPSTVELRYAPAARSTQEHMATLRDAVFAACASLDVMASPSALTLSGGYDSRSLLVGLVHTGKPVTCLTWGLAASLDDPVNDAMIARQLAARFNLRHEYLFLDTADDPVRDIFTRFLRAGEGRVEDFSGYTDGFKAWAHIFESGIATIIRGDSPGWGFPFPPINDFVTRSIVHEMTLVSDYPESELIHRLGLAQQEPPAGLFIEEGETLDHYRDRIYNGYELPACMAAFNQVKSAYAEVVNPLFARGVVKAASELPDELRHMRCGFEAMVRGLVGGIPFAQRGADEPLERYLGRPEVVEEFEAELSSADARLVFSPAALDAVLAAMRQPLGGAKTRARRLVRSVVPRRVVRAVRPAPRPHLDTLLLAFRMYIASRMAAILREDAQALPLTAGS